MRLLPRLVCGVILQLLFTLVVIYISTAWLVSLAPFLDSTSLDYVPSFVWPDPPTLMKSWILDQNATAVIPTWAVCNDTTTTTEAFVKYLWMPFCLTDIAVPLFFFFVAASTFSFLYTLVVILLIWPCISNKWKEEWEERGPEREREEAQRTQEFDREQNQEVKWERNVNSIQMEGVAEAKGGGVSAGASAEASAGATAAAEETEVGPPVEEGRKEEEDGVGGGTSAEQALDEGVDQGDGVDGGTPAEAAGETV